MRQLAWMGSAGKAGWWRPWLRAAQFSVTIGLIAALGVALLIRLLMVFFSLLGGLISLRWNLPKLAECGQPMRSHITDYPRYVWQLLNGFRVNHERAFANARQQDIASYLDRDRSLQVLDLANGRLRPQYALLKAAGHQVYGIDLVNRPRSGWNDVAYRVARWLYTWKLGLPAEITAGRTLVCGDVSALPFPDNCFDLATSVAAFEHFLDVPAVVTELARVVRPGGLVWVCIHFFTSPSGGHNLSFIEIPLRTIPTGVDPWDHLRERRLPFHVPLNEWRRDQYLETFTRHFHILKHYCAMREGGEFLTPEIEAELSAYSRDELTCGAYVILARKEP